MVKLLLKKSYQHKDLKEIKFKDLWNSYGVFTTMRIFGKPPKILFFKDHIDKLMFSLNKYKIKKKNLKKNILKIIKLNIKHDKKYDHLLRIASNKYMISISLRKRLKINKNFILKLVNYKRVDPEYKNLKYKKILYHLKKLNTNKYDIALFKKNRILETGTSNLLFIRGKQVFSPIKNFYKGTTLNFFSKKINIRKKNIHIDSLNIFNEIIIVGSGKGVVSVKSIKNTDWKRKSLNYYRILSKIYNKAVANCVRYNG